MNYTTEQLKQMFDERHGSQEIEQLITNAKRIGNEKAVQIGEQRLAEVFHDAQTDKCPVHNALMKQFQAYEAVLSEKAKTKQIASYSRQKIKKSRCGTDVEGPVEQGL